MTDPNWLLVTTAKESKRALSAARVKSILKGADLDAQLAAFARRGYHFERTDSNGLRIVAWPRRLFAEEIACGLGTETVGRRIEVHWKVPSTNDLARAQAARGREGTVVFTEEQTAGRGRFGRVWRAGKFSSLLFSSALLSPGGTVGTEGLMLAGAVAAAEAIRETSSLDAQIRWPNDVVVEEHKVCGVLVESLSAADGDRWLVVGTGVNVNADEDSFAGELRNIAGSLSMFAGREIDRALLAREILRRLDFWWEVLKAGDTTRLGGKWRWLSSILGKFITVKSGGRKHFGRVVDLDAHFGLVLQMSGGGTRVFEPSKTTLLHE